MLIKKSIFCIACVYCVFLLCTFNVKNDDPLTISRIGNLSDTVSIWPQLNFVFSVPLIDSLVSINITPDPGSVFNTFLNKTRDSLMISITESLLGNTIYTITFDKTITSENGNTISAGDSICSIVTLPQEMEPNNTVLLADTLLTVCMGIISPAHDTDVFYLNNNLSKTVYMTNHKGKSGFIIKSTNDSLISIEDGLNENKTFLITDSSILPLYIYIFSIFENSTHYELGIVK